MERINVGNQNNDGTGDSIREAFKKVNANFSELYGINNLGEGLFFTKLKDTPQALTPSSVTTASVIVVDNFGNTLTNKKLIAGEGIVITNTGTITISNPNVSLSKDLFPTLGGNLDGNGFRGVNFSNPVSDNDLATKTYVDNNGPYSKINLYVSATRGTDSFDVTVPKERYGRSLAYAFKTIYKACEYAYDLITTSSLTLSTYEQFIQQNNGATTSTVYSTAPSSAISGTTRVFINRGGAAGTDQYIARYLRPGQLIKGQDTETIGQIYTLGQTSEFPYNKTKCSRDTGLIVDAIVNDLLFAGQTQVTFAGVQYWNHGSYVGAIASEFSTLTNAIAYIRDIAQKVIVNDTSGTRYQVAVPQNTSGTAATASEQGIVASEFNTVLNILNSGVAGVTDAISPSGITASSTASVVNAYTNLQANKDYLKAEAIAYVTSPLGGGFSETAFSTSTCARDIGYIIDSVSFDLLYGGNLQAIESGVYYYSYNASSTALPNEQSQTIDAYNYIRSILPSIITGTPLASPKQAVVTQVTTGPYGTGSEGTTAQGLVDIITSIINLGPTVANPPAAIGLTMSGSVNVQRAAEMIHKNRAFIVAETIAFIDTNTSYSGTYEYYDVAIISGAGFRGQTPSLRGEYLQFAQTVPKLNITIHIESGIYEEQLPIKVPESVSLRGDEFRRVVIKPAPGVSTSKWAKIWFRRDEEFDGLTKASNSGNANLAANSGARFGYHYLTNPSDITSTAKNNEDMDVFLLNDQTILRAIGAQGHGGFMCVLDPEGQIRTKSPYIQNVSSFSRSTNQILFGGGEYVDGFVGNLEATATNVTTYWTGTLTIAVGNLKYRQPQTPTAFYIQGNRYEVDYVTDYNSTLGTANLHLNPTNPGGIAFPNGVITIYDYQGKAYNGASGYGGKGYSTAPYVLFGQPTNPGGYAAKGVATINAAGTVTSVTITNPGSGYSANSTVTVQFIGGNPITPSPDIGVSTSNIKIGYIGTLSYKFELLTAGNKSMLNADFTQVNDQGYGIVAQNIAFSENVSIFTYYANVAYYSNNGGQLRSLNGSNAYGNYALKANGADPNELPIPVLLMNDMVQTATVVSGALGSVNTVNTTTSAYLYIRNYQYLPNAKSEVEVDHGNAVDAAGNTIGVQVYTVASVNTVSSTIVPDLAVLNFSTGAALGLSAGGLKAPVSTGTRVTIRGASQFTMLGVNNATFLRTASSNVFDESTATDYAIVDYDYSNLTNGKVNLTFNSQYKYIELQTYSGWVPDKGLSTIRVVDLNTATSNAVKYYISGGAGYSQWGTATQLTFGWKDGIYRITNYTSSATLGQPYATVDISPALGSTITNYANTLTFTLKAGLRKYATAKISNRLSTLRVTGHDLVDIGTGGFAATRIPNDLYGPPDNKPSSGKEIIQTNKGRVFAVTTDQDGNFRVGNVFKVNQATGDLTINAALSLSGVSGLQFSRGDTAREFSNDDLMAKLGSDVIPTQAGVVGYINHRLGLNQAGSSVAKLGSGYLDLTGTQSMAGSIKMSGNQIDMQTAKIINLTTGTNPYDAANKFYVDAYSNKKLAIAGTDYTDPLTGAGNSAFGKMTGPLILNTDPNNSTQDGSTAATLRYVDKVRQFNTLSDVNLVSPVDVDLLMFTNSFTTVNTTTNTKPVWSTGTIVTNVRNDARPSDNTSSANAGGSDITISRWVNTVTFKLVGGLGDHNPITDYHVNNSAAIAQSKLNMNAATTRVNAAAISQADLGLASFDPVYFGATGGWITLANTSSFLVNAVSASKVAGTLTRGTYLTGGNFDGSTNQTWAVDADSNSTAGKIVVRDVNQDFSAGTITASLNGTANVSKIVSKTIAANTEENLVEATIATNDFVRIRAGGVGNAGWLEIATADDGTEPIYVRQYNNAFSGAPARTAKLLDEGGHTWFPGGVTATSFSGSFIGGVTGNVTGNLDGIANCAKYLWVDGSAYYTGCSASKSNTIAYRDGSCNITANCFVGVATNAQYADLAEKYKGDACYPPCTVLAFGGVCEVTIAAAGTNRVAGVVSTNPAHVMNSGLTGDNIATVALMGRVPVKVRGKISKGDLMISAGGGFAEPCANPVIGSVIGKALEDFDGGEGIIEIVVGRL